MGTIGTIRQRVDIVDPMVQLVNSHLVSIPGIGGLVDCIFSFFRGCMQISVERAQLKGTNRHVVVERRLIIA